MVERSPLPWHSVENSWQYTTVYDANDNHIFRHDLEDWSVTEDNQDELEAEQARLVNFIVKAVNSHDALVSHLRRLAIHGCDDEALALADSLTASMEAKESASE